MLIGRMNGVRDPGAWFRLQMRLPLSNAVPAFNRSRLPMVPSPFARRCVVVLIATRLATAAVAAIAAPLPRLKADDLPGGIVDAAASALACLPEHRWAPGTTLTLIDYGLPSTERRLWTFDLSDGRLLFHEHVAHGSGSGDNIAREFSNRPGSRQTSLGLFRTADTYRGRNGYSLRLDGLNPGVNDHARERAIVVHGAPYVSERTITQFGRLGRSWGCPAVRTDVARAFIDRIKHGSYVFAYHAGQGSVFRCGAAQ